MIIKGKRIYTEEKGCIAGRIHIEHGKITQIEEHYERPADIDYGDMRILPGIIDTHNHGCRGYSMRLPKEASQAEREKNIRGYLRELSSMGVTGAFPTCSTAMIKNIHEAKQKAYPGARILGIHSEGPWLSRVGEKGKPKPCPPADAALAAQMVKDGGGDLKLVALAPEVSGMDAVIDVLLAHGVHVSMAHTDANYEQAKQAIRRGIKGATHLANVMTGLHHRDIGTLGACLLAPDVYCEIICDGMHVSLPMLQLMLRVKDTQHFVMISDNSEYSGLPTGLYHGAEAGAHIHMTEDGYLLSDEGRICGSSQPVLFGIKNLVEKLHIPMETVWRMASLHAAQRFGFADERGSLAAGKYADLIVIDEQYHCQATYVEGQMVYDCHTSKPQYHEAFLAQKRIS